MELEGPKAEKSLGLKVQRGKQSNEMNALGKNH
jgi:hypothetical protein